MDTDCFKCENSGIYYRPNGEDDFDAEICDCEWGRGLENRNGLKNIPITWLKSNGIININHN